MYRPEKFVEDRQAVLADAIRNIQLAALITPVSEAIEVTHVPFVVREEGSQIILETHVARATTHWKAAGNGAKSLAIFQGPHAYVSPSFYPSKLEHGKVVPTWVYIVVHAHGVLETIDDPSELLHHLNNLTDNNEFDRDEPWSVSDAPERYLESMKRGIVGLRLRVTRLEGAWKLNQHKDRQDWTGTVDGLRDSGESGRALADALHAVKTAEQSN